MRYPSIGRTSNSSPDIAQARLVRWRLRRQPASSFDPVPYGIALQPGSPLREQINASLLEMLTDGTYDRILKSDGG
jgi:ABC-type amino acid transport substrate-binding protein